MNGEDKIPECELGNTLEKIQDNRKVYSKFGIDSLKVRPCELYYEEYKDCSTLKSKLRDLYIGTANRSYCREWYDNYVDCYKFRDKKDLESFGRIVESEKRRVKSRLEESAKNNVWTYREEPPKDFDQNPILPKQPEMTDRYSPFETFESIKENRKKHLKDAKAKLNDFII